MLINSELKKEYPWGDAEWKKRTEILANIIPAGVSVLDIGGGLCNLNKYLSDCKYISLDLKCWTNLTFEADFNKGQYPDVGKYQYLVCQGILEYMENPEDFLNRIKKYGNRLILTYLYRPKGQMEMHRNNNMDFDELAKLFEKAGWTKQMQRLMTTNHRIFYLSKNV